MVEMIEVPEPEALREAEAVMTGSVQDIEDLAVKNPAFRRVLYTAKHCQLVVMALRPNEEIGAEVHTLDQFFRVEEGTGEAVMDGVRTQIRAGFAVVVPAGAKHIIVNTGLDRPVGSGFAPVDGDLREGPLRAQLCIELSV